MITNGDFKINNYKNFEIASKNSSKISLMKETYKVA